MITVRPGEPADAHDIQVILYRTWIDTYPDEAAGISREDIEAFWGDPLSAERLERQERALSRRDDRGRTLIAHVDDEAAGCCHVERADDHGELRMIYVLPEFQRRGVGSLLWREALGFLDPSKDVVVRVAAYNAKAIAFYRALGFVDTGRRLERFRMPTGAVIPEIEMARQAARGT